MSSTLGKDADDWWTLFRSGMWRLYLQLSAEGRERYFNELMPLLHDTKAEVLGDRDGDAYYLVYLGTKPHARGRGYARKLLQTMIDRVRVMIPSSLFSNPPPGGPNQTCPHSVECFSLSSHLLCSHETRADQSTTFAPPPLQADAENRPVYLESSSVTNNAYYAKFGFVVKKDIFLKRGPAPVQLSIMVREPQPAARFANGTTTAATATSTATANATTLLKTTKTAAATTASVKMM